MYSQKVPEYFLLGELPKQFMNDVARILLNYSVALGYKSHHGGTKFFGSGVLVHRDGHYGILTAHHNLHNEFRDFQSSGSFHGNPLVIAFKSSHPVLPPEILIEHQLGIPKRKRDKPDEPGEPDLTFIEICECSQLSLIKSVNSFWSLDKNPYEVQPAFGRIEMSFCVNGYPGNDYKKITEGKTIRHELKHMSYFYVHGCESFSEADEWDYVEAKDKKGDGLPSSFKGMSGGPVWGLRIKKLSDTNFELTGYSLIGINLSQIESGQDEISVRAHFIRSIYDTAWRKIQWRLPGIIVPSAS